MNHTADRRRRALLGALVLTSLLALTGCSTTVRPTYAPTVGAKSRPVSGGIALRVVDKIENTAPLTRQVTARERVAKIAVFGLLLGSTMKDVDTGQQMISEQGPYKLDAPPAVVAHRVFAAALEREGIRVVDNAPDKLEVQLLRFETVLGTRRGETKVKTIGHLLLHASLQRAGQSLAETTILELNEYDAGLAMTGAELGTFVSASLSKAAEHALSDEKLSPILEQLRQRKE